MKLFQANTEGTLTSGIAVRRDESHRPYIFVGADLTLGPSIGVKNPSREVGVRVYLTGALWKEVLNKCGGGSEFVYEADLIAGPDGTFVLGPCSGDTESALVNCAVTNWVETNVSHPSVDPRRAVTFDGKTAFIPGETYLYTSARMVPLKVGEQVAFNWVDREPDQDTSAIVEGGSFRPRPISKWKDVPKTHAVGFAG